MNQVFAGGDGHRPGAEQFTLGAAAAMLSTVAAIPDLPSRLDWHNNSLLLGELASLNQRIARYIVNALDADDGRAEPVSPADEATLGRTLLALGQQLTERSQQRAAAGASAVAGDRPAVS